MCAWQESTMDDGERRGELKRKKGQKITMRMRTCRTNERNNVRWEGRQMKYAERVNVRQREKEDAMWTGQEDEK